MIDHAAIPMPLSPIAGRNGRKAARVGALVTWFVADWRDMLFVHYRVSADVLQSHVPHPLELQDGSAWVSLVYFTLERMRPPGTGLLGQALLRPVSGHAFLNVRTYVRAEAGPGIHFLAEWIPNRLSAWMGPRTYGLPYRLAHFDCDLAGTDGGVGRITVDDPTLDARLELAFPTRPATSAPARCGSDDAFLLERYTAYTSRAGVRRCFRVAHAPWKFHAVDWLQADLTLIARAFPWFAAAEFHRAHRSSGACDVRMSRPARLLD